MPGLGYDRISTLLNEYGRIISVPFTPLVACHYKVQYISHRISWSRERENKRTRNTEISYRISQKIPIVSERESLPHVRANTLQGKQEVESSDCDGSKHRSNRPVNNIGEIKGSWWSRSFESLKHRIHEVKRTVDCTSFVNYSRRTSKIDL